MVHDLTRTHASLAATPLPAYAARRGRRQERVKATPIGRVTGEVRPEMVRQTTPTMQRNANRVPGNQGWRPPV